MSCSPARSRTGVHVVDVGSFHGLFSSASSEDRQWPSRFAHTLHSSQIPGPETSDWPASPDAFASSAAQRRNEKDQADEDRQSKAEHNVIDRDPRHSIASGVKSNDALKTESCTCQNKDQANQEQGGHGEIVLLVWAGEHHSGRGLRPLGGRLGYPPSRRPSRVIKSRRPDTNRTLAPTMRSCP